MKINIKTTNIKLDEPLKIWVEQKLGELDRFLGSFASDSMAAGVHHREKVELWVEIGRTTHHHLKGEVFKAEAQLYLPNKTLRSEVIHEDLRAAITVVKDELQNAIKEYKGKRIDRARSWARKTKEWIRVSEVVLTRQGEKILEIMGVHNKKKKK